jgi:hypothetical protein
MVQVREGFSTKVQQVLDGAEILGRYYVFSSSFVASARRYSPGRAGDGMKLRSREEVFNLEQNVLSTIPHHECVPQSG